MPLAAHAPQVALLHSGSRKGKGETVSPIKASTSGKAVLHSGGAVGRPVHHDKGHRKPVERLSPVWGDSLSQSSERIHGANLGGSATIPITLPKYPEGGEGEARLPLCGLCSIPVLQAFPSQWDGMSQ